MNEKMIQEDVFAAELVERLFDPQKEGVVFVGEALNPETCTALVDEVRKSNSCFERADHSRVGAYGLVDVLYVGDADPQRKECILKLVTQLQGEYQLVYDLFGKHAEFQGKINSIGIHKYEQNSPGLDAHVDSEKYVNLIAIFVLCGSAPFTVYGKSRGSYGLSCTAMPGTVILMRAPRKPEENILRPVHSVGRVLEKRITLTFRQIK